MIQQNSERLDLIFFFVLVFLFHTSKCLIIKKLKSHRLDRCVLLAEL